MIAFNYHHVRSSRSVYCAFPSFHRVKFSLSWGHARSGQRFSTCQTLPFPTPHGNIQTHEGNVLIMLRREEIKFYKNSFRLFYAVYYAAEKFRKEDSSLCCRERSA